MGSVHARAVAKEVLETLGRGERVSVSKIAPKHSYTQLTADSGSIQKTASYKEVMQSTVTAMERERSRLIESMEHKSLKKVDYRTHADAVQKLTHDIQLLSGGKTENVTVDEDRRILIGIVKELRQGYIEPPIEQSK